MARRRKKARRAKKSIAIVPTAAAVVGIGGGFVEGYRQAGPEGAMTQGIYRLTGYDVKANTFTPSAATGGMLILGTAAATMVARKLRLNSYITLPRGWRLF